MTNSAVAVHGLTKIFPVPFHPTRGVVAVKDLNLRIEPGEVYGLLGPNGSGKSTTLKIILGLVSPTRGCTEIFGQDSRLVQSRDAVGFLPENPYFQKFLTGKETLRFFGRLCGLRGAKLRNRVNELLDLVGLNKARNRRLGTYSKGMLQRIGLAQALVHDPRLVVLDEADRRCRSGRVPEHLRFDPRPERPRNHRAAFFAFARTSAGDLRPHRHPCRRRPGARGAFARFDRDRKSNRVCNCRCFRRARPGNRIGR